VLNLVRGEGTPPPPPGEESARATEYCVYEHDILVIKDLFRPVADLLATANRINAWAPSGVIDLFDNAQPGWRTSWKHDFSSRIHPEMAALETEFTLSAHTGVRLYSWINAHAQVNYNSGYEILRYEEGQHYGEHIDLIPGRPIAAQGEALTAYRLLSMVAFLNGDCEGGELYFPRQRVSIKPEAGTFVYFPSSYTHPHASLDVTRGTKYSVVTWYFFNSESK
jgi:hypothetical protein